ncbi:MAG: sialate O-acetylesterase [Chthoniobacteraceae bacterium]|nr:sialate O-acetylesterase [Chthoniobacteraceae bacterium]
MRKSLLFLLPAVLGLPVAQADVTLPPLISDNVLLQSGHAAVWGQADPGEKVTVTLGKTKATATADKNGKWRVQLLGLKPGEAGAMTVAGKNNLTVQNVAVGDVWVCSGQSNMEMTVTNSSPGYRGVIDYQKEIADANHPQLRLFTVPRKPSETPLAEIAGKWEVCTPETVPHWSATGYFFGRQLQQDLKIPIGLIHTSWGGTSAQAWTPTDALQGDADFKAAYYDTRQAELANLPALKEKYEKETLPAWQAAADAAKAEGKQPPRKPRGPFGPNEGPTASALFNGMIAGATPFPIKGAIWYQGEANAWEGARYRRLLPAMITAWREAWNEKDFPFYIVQLASYMAPRTEPGDSKWAELRDAQRVIAETLPHTGLAVAIDIGEPDNIHPINKQEVGRRLALAAEAKTYGKPVVYSGPWIDAAKFDGAQVKITFKPGTAEGLAAKDGAAIKGFAIAGEDKKFVWAEAKIVEPAPTKTKGKKQPKEAAPAQPTLVLSAPGVEKPVAVRYAWANSPAVNLVNKAGLPAVPFRTDDWPQVEQKPAPAATPAAKPSATPSPTATPAPSPAATPVAS